MTIYQLRKRIDDIVNGRYERPSRCPACGYETMTKGKMVGVALHMRYNHGLIYKNKSDLIFLSVLSYLKQEIALKDISYLG